VLLEAFEGTPAKPLRGTSVSSYNAGKSVWQQTWADNFGSYMTFEGGLDSTGRMILARSVQSDTVTIHQRMVFDNIASDSLDWYWERSTDDDVSWKLLWQEHYTRRK
jgi:hypothetical protein